MKKEIYIVKGKKIIEFKLKKGINTNMKKELIIVIIIVIAIIILDTITHNYTKNNFAKINEQLEQIKKISENIAKKEKERESDKNSKQQELQEKIKIMEEDWQAINKNTAFYIEHEELEKVNASMIKFKSYIQLEEYTEAISELENCKYILDHIRDKEAMQIINLF